MRQGRGGTKEGGGATPFLCAPDSEHSLVEPYRVTHCRNLFIFHKAETNSILMRKETLADAEHNSQNDQGFVCSGFFLFLNVGMSFFFLSMLDHQV